MRWLLPWILATSSILQAIAQTSTTMTPTVPATTEAYTRTQYCKWPCECPKSPPRCSVGVSLVTDGCDCCKTCAKQRGESCTEADTCDFHRGLYCDYSGDRPRYEIGVCAPYEGEDEAWQKNCIVHTSPWSPCSKTCGLGISTRISNDNDQCRLMKESRLCNMRPCEVDITKHIKPGKKCLAVYRASEPMNYTISGCVSKSPYRPKYCGVCTDNRCCTPYKSKTIEVRFECPDGTEISWKIMWINACFCNLNCKNPNDIFADLAHYHDYSEIAN
uniref:CCN family member 3 n=1 Tax=Anas zonorhyncha TaxID=75864 RepID=A0A8B9TWZ0_9AVES